MVFFRSLIEMLKQNIILGDIVLPFSLLGLLTRVLIPFIGMILVYLFLLWGTVKILSLIKVKDEIAGSIRKYVRLVLKIFVLVGFIVSVGSLLEKEIYYWFGQFLNVLNQPFYVSGSTRISIVTILMLIPVFTLASWSGRYIRKLLDSTLFEQFGIDDAQRFSIGSLTRYIVMTIVLFIGLSVVGIDLSSLSVLLGVLGIGLGFGLQGIVANIFAGLIIISTRPIKEGDRILVNGYDGIVQHIRFISTDIKTFQNENIIIPNSFFVDNAVHNYSYADKKIVTVNEVGVSYNSDLEKVRVLLEEILEKNPYKLQGPENVVRILSFGDNGINVALRTLVKDVSFKADSFSWTNMEIWRTFKREGIEIPFPQRDVHIVSMPEKEILSQSDNPDDI